MISSCQIAEHLTDNSEGLSTASAGLRATRRMPRTLLAQASLSTSRRQFARWNRWTSCIAISNTQTVRYYWKDPRCDGNLRAALEEPTQPKT